MAIITEIEPLSISPARNGVHRRKFAFIPETAARIINEEAPEELSNPNNWTLASAVITPIAVFKTTLRNIYNPEGIDFTQIPAKSVDEAAGIGGAELIDWFDGPLAREKNRVKPGSHDTRVGGSYDSLNDRWGNFVMGTSRILAAFFRGDRYGMFMATGSTIAGAIPAYQRSREEENGRTYPESGNGWKDLLGFFGSHAGRTILAVAGTLYPNIKIDTYGWKTTIPVQRITDTLSCTASSVMIFRRLKKGTPTPLPDPEDQEAYKKKLAQIEEIKEDAVYRTPRLRKAAIATGIIAGGLYLFLATRTKKGSSAS